jgi:hypothetical protein
VKVVHVGLPKTGTSFLQRTLWLNEDLLAKRGVRQPMENRAELFAATMYVRGEAYDWDPTGYDPEQAWRRIVKRSHAWSGTTVISSEWLCLAARDQAQQALAALGEDVHLVLTLRDLARQVPAEWQEGVKHGRRLSFAEYLECVLGGHGRPSLRQRFWRAQDVVGVCDRWAADLPPERVHLVTCPPSGARPDLLWARFAEVLDISPDGVQLPGGDINASLGAVQVELLRRLNEHFPRTGQEIDYRAVVKDYYARDVLGAFPSEKTVLPASWSSTVEKIGSGWVEKLGRRGYRVVGDLTELVPASRTTEAEPPPPDGDRMLDMSVRSTAVLLHEIRRLRRQRGGVRRRVVALAKDPRRHLPRLIRAAAARVRRRISPAD